MINTNNIYLNIAPNVGVDLLWWLTSLFAVIGIVYILTTFYTKSSLMLGIKRKKIKKRELGPIVSEFLFFDENTATLEDKNTYISLKIQIRQLLKNKRDRKVLAEVLVELSQDLSGETLRSLHSLYKNLGLEKDALIKLKSWKWYTISQGILELTQMKVTDSYNQITKFVNDRRGVIHKQSVIAIVSLKDEGINYFLDTTQHKISEWQQLKLLEILQNKKDFNPPRFKNWLFSKNTDTVLFALRLLKYYDQNDGNEAIIQLIRHKNSLIRLEAIQCVGEFFLVEARETLKNVFWVSNNDCKLLIIEVIETLGFKEDVAFLKLIEDSKQVFAVKNKAYAAINGLMPENHLKLDGLEEISSDYLDSLINTKELKEKEASFLEEKISEEKQNNNTIEEVENIKTVKEPEDKKEENINLEFTIEDIEEDTVKEIAPIDDEKHIEFIKFLDSKNEEFSSEIYDELYFKQDKDKKLELLEKIEDTGTSYEISLLENIIKKETNEQLKEKAEFILNRISKNQEDIIEEVDPKIIFLPEQTVFKNLYENCDTEAKLILLEEISMLGDRKELNFVIEELKSSEHIIRQKAAKVKLILEKRIENESIEEVEAIIENDTLVLPKLEDVEFNINMDLDSTTTDKAVEPVLECDENKLMPLEYCFLMEELEIKPQKPFSLFNIDFELSDEFYTDQYN